MFFSQIPKNIDHGLSAERACEVGAITEGNIFGTDQKISYYCVYYPDMLKTYQRQTKLYEFLWNTNGEGLDLEKTVSLCTGFVAMASM